MNSKVQIAADAIGSVRAEGLEPGSAVLQVLDRWVEGTIETDQLGDAAQRLATGGSVDHLLGRAQTVSS